MKKIIFFLVFIFCFLITIFCFLPVKVFAADPIGYLDSADCTQITGWSVDPNFLNSPNQVAIFKDGPAGSGTLLGYITANQPRESALCNAVGGSNCAVCDSDPSRPQCAHGFVFQTPDSLKDGQTHQIYVHGMHIDNQGENPLLQLVPRSIACGSVSSGNGSISATVNGYPLTIKTTNRLAGAIDSLIWKGKEFVNSADHGRQIQTAWTVNGLGQCYNPTEAGSAADGTGLTSSSVLLDYKITAVNSYYTKSLPAFWDAPGQYDAGCNFSLQGTNGPWLGGTAINTKVTSDWLLEKWVTIGFEGIPNVIKYVSKITVPANPGVTINYIILDQPSAHLPGEFSFWKQYDPSSGTLVPPSTNHNFSNHPHVLSTANGSFAISVYSPEIPEQGLENLPQYPYQGYFVYIKPYGINLSVNGERIAKTEAFTPESTHTYTSYIVIGTQEQVRQSLQSLYALNNPSPTPIPPTSTPIPPTPTPLPVPGDINHDSNVNIYDYNILLQNFGNTTCNNVADIDGNCKVDIFDYNVLVGNFGSP